MNVAEQLANEIERVTKLRSQYESLRGLPNCNPEFAILGITASLEAAKKAAGMDDVLAQIAALQDLQEYTE